MTNSLDTLLIVGVLAVIVILANVAERRTDLKPLIFLILLATNVIFVAFFGFAAPTLQDVPVSFEAAAWSRLVAALVGVLTTLMLFPGFRRRLAAVLPRRGPRQHETDASAMFHMSAITPATPVPTPGFDPESPVHMTALVLCTYLLAGTFLNLLLVGGMSGLAQQFDQSGGLEINDQMVQMVIFILFAALGVGLNVRRPLEETLDRLGLHLPTPRELLIGSGTALVMMAVAYGIGVAWQVAVGEDVVAQQTQVSALLSQSITTLGIALLISGTAAIGEEIAFRGALQPVLGIGVTTVLFALVHAQYALTPASLIIVVVGLALAVLRQRYNTTTAIVAHFLYNYGQMFLLIWVRYALA